MLVDKATSKLLGQIKPERIKPQKIYDLLYRIKESQILGRNCRTSHYQLVIETAEASYQGCVSLKDSNIKKRNLLKLLQIFSAQSEVVGE